LHFEAPPFPAGDASPAGFILMKEIKKIIEIIDRWANSITYDRDKTPKQILGEEDIELLKRMVRKEVEG